jgi:hypothetical protein
MFETKLLRNLDYDKLAVQAASLGTDGWRIMTGWYGQNAHFLALQRSTPKYTGIIRPMIPAPKPAPKKGKSSDSAPHHKGRGTGSKGKTSDKPAE